LADEIRILPQWEDLGSNCWRENLARLAELISLPRSQISQILAGREAGDK
jgi:hypothetical protein